MNKPLTSGSSRWILCPLKIVRILLYWLFSSFFQKLCQHNCNTDNLTNKTIFMTVSYFRAVNRQGTLLKRGEKNCIKQVWHILQNCLSLLIEETALLTSDFTGVSVSSISSARMERQKKRHVNNARQEKSGKRNSLSNQIRVLTRTSSPITGRRINKGLAVLNSAEQLQNFRRTTFYKLWKGAVFKF